MSETRIFMIHTTQSNKNVEITVWCDENIDYDTCFPGVYTIYIEDDVALFVLRWGEYIVDVTNI